MSEQTTTDASTVARRPRPMAMHADENIAGEVAREPATAHPIWPLVASVIVAALVVFASIVGLVAPWPYEQETENWVLQAWGQDVGNIVAAVLLVAGALGAWRGSLRARQLWIGTLFYFLYAYAIYAFAVHFGRLFSVYVTVLGLAFWTLVAVLSERARLLASPSRRVCTFAASVLIGTGALFALLWLSELIPATLSGRPPSSLETAGLVTNPIYVIDLAIVLPGMIIVGIGALRASARELSFVLPALTFCVLMGSSVIAASLLMVVRGDTSGVAPLVAVTVVVGLSLWAAVSWIRQGRRAPLASA
ncbi:hypothetical protein [Microbacterium sp. E-13]|uniref:hypothetical protein n=1 Tax=Microbacterium sp. E-13 TaxID=3404048 RepID=UPI003CED2FF5